MLSFIKKVKGDLAKRILHTYGAWFYYDYEYHRISLYIRGSEKHPIKTGINPSPDRWLWCNSQDIEEKEKQLINTATYEFKVELDFDDEIYIRNAWKELYNQSKKEINEY